MPCSGPRNLPCMISASAARAAAMATSGVRVMKALSCGSSAWVRASRLSVYSVGESLRAEISWAASTSVSSCSAADGMTQLQSKGHSGGGAMARQYANPYASAHEIVAEALAVGRDPTDGRVGEMDRQDERGRVGHLTQEAAARLCGLLLIGVEDRGPAMLPA